MTKKVKLIGVPIDLGASLRGTGLGAGALRVAGLRHILETMGYEVADYGDVQCHFHSSKLSDSSSEKLNYLSEITATSYKLKEAVSEAISEGYFPIVLGGDHSIAIGTMAGMKELHGGKTGIIWVDAHGDFNTPQTTPSGNIHGMPFAVLTNRGDKRLLDIGPSPTVLEENSVLIGARDLDSGEIENLRDSKVTVFTMSDIDREGMPAIAKKAIEIASKNVDYFHVSFDIDVVDPQYAPGTGTRVSGGFTVREAHTLMEMVHESGKLASLEMVEINPTLDIRNRTAELGANLIGSALGTKTYHFRKQNTL